VALQQQQKSDTTPPGDGGPPTDGEPQNRHTPKVIIALRRFAISMSVFNIAGYLFLGFEQPWAWPLIALATGYTVEIVLEWIGARVEGRAPRFLGGGARGVFEFLLPAHITSLAVNMLIYVNDRVWVMMFAVTLAVSSKWILRVPVRGRMRHYMNPSNLGILMVLVLFPWGSIAPPYHFTEHLNNWGSYILVGIILISGTILNAKLTERMWLIAGWLSFFALQAVARGLVFDTAIPSALLVMSGVAFILYTNYMVTDPGTTPSKPASQFAFGAGVAIVYAVFMLVHIAYGLFFATAIVCAVRGAFLWSLHFVDKARAEREAGERAAAEQRPLVALGAADDGPVSEDGAAARPAAA
jgi:enediyne biosynthesis protein E5